MARAKASIGTVDYATAITAGHHRLTADEGPELGGEDAGPAPYDLLISALGACTVITLRMYAERKQWPVTAVHADLHFKREDKAESIDRVLHIEGAVDAEQKKRMAEIAERTPVTLTLKRSLEIRTTLAP
jgi:putative redox protein